MEQSERLALFSQMIRGCHNLHFSAYDSSMRLIQSNLGPEEKDVDALLRSSAGCSNFLKMLQQAQTPVLLSNELGLLWSAQPYFEEDELVRVYLLGPYFLDDIATQKMEEELAARNISPQLQAILLNFLRGLPVLSISRMVEYCIMLHYCLTETYITASDLRYAGSAISPPADKAIDTFYMDAHSTWQAEKEMLRIVREGDITKLHAQMNRMALSGSLGRLSPNKYLRHAQNAVLACITLFCRAAIDGGLPAELGYSLADRYFVSVEGCRTVSDLGDLAMTMQEDFVRRVYRCRQQGFSGLVQKCRAYIDVHFEEDITVAALAAKMGYSESYLGKKFKKETGQTILAYLRQKRLERAAHLLRTDNEDVQKISMQLHFCSQSYFAEHFRAQYGVTPSAYRAGVNASSE